MKRSELFFNALLVPLDYLFIFLATFVAYSLRLYSPVIETFPVLYELEFNYYIKMAAFSGIFVVFVYAIEGLYSMKVTRSLFKEFVRIFSATSAALIVFIVAAFLNRDFFSSRFILIGTWFLIIIFVSTERFLVRFLQRKIAQFKNVGTHRVLVVGTNEISDQILRFLRAHSELPYKIVARIPEISDQKLEYYKNKIDEALVCDPSLPYSKMGSLARFCELNRIDFKYVPNLFAARATNIEIRSLAGFPVVEIKRTPLDGWGRVIKRLFDITVSLILIVLLSPLFLVLSALIKIDSRGPVFVRLKRISQGREFKMLKFRSMIKNAHKLKEKLMKYNERKDGPLFKMTNDPRITRFGRFLRKSRLDEFAQLFNVFKGEMSLVGPRPHEPEEIKNYKLHHKKVLTIKSGITGMAQVSGSSKLNFEDEVGLDVYYIENWSLVLDLIILVKTFLVVVRIITRGDKSAV